VAQWIGQFSGNTHKTAVLDAEQLLQHAVTVLNDASLPDRKKKAKSVQALAKRVYAARVRFLKAAIVAATDPATDEVVAKHTRQVTKLEDALTAVTRGGPEAIVREFSATAVQDLL
jgi:hypothetical protein